MSDRLQVRRGQSAVALLPVQGGLLQRKCACGGSAALSGQCEECRKEDLEGSSSGAGLVQRHTAGAAQHVAEVPPIVHEVLRSPGQPLDAATRAFFEPRFGHDFSRVRIHTDDRAAESARAVNARAYTVGRDVVFARGQYLPRTAPTQALVAHELTHVVQQDTGGSASPAHGIAGVLEPAEKEARDISAHLQAGESYGIRTAARTGIIQRFLDEKLMVEAATQVGKGTAAAGGALLAAIAAGLTVLLWPSEIAPEPEVPKPDRPKRPECYGGWGPPRGGDSTHDEYARLVATKYGNPAFAGLNFYLGRGGLVADFDHYDDSSNEFLEAKTRHEILLREWAKNQPLVLARLFEQAERQFEIIVQCAPSYPPPRLIWFFDDPDVAEVAAGYLGGIVDEVRHEPWPKGERPARKKAK